MSTCSRLLLSPSWRGLERENQFLKNNSFLDNLAGLLLLLQHLNWCFNWCRNAPRFYHFCRTHCSAFLRNLPQSGADCPGQSIVLEQVKRWNLLARRFVVCSSSRGTGPFYGEFVFLETRVQARRISSSFIGIGGWCPFLWTSKDSFSWSGFREILMLRWQV